MNNKPEDLRNKMNDTKDTLKNIASEAKTEAQHKLGDMQECIEAYVKKNPMKSLSYAVLVGIVVAQLLHLHK